ncbi:MAG: nitroreductase family protein [Clostridia bacterium]|nr:nitroreductase family protein [Clostridia bacterium]
MEFLKLAQDRYSVRKFKPEKVERDVIGKILKAGHVAPTACNYQPQRIFVIESPEGIEKLKNCTRCHFDAPLAMLVCYNKDEVWTRKYDGENSGFVDASIVTTHMMMEATESGVGSTWVMHFNPIKMVEEFLIPENIVPVALLVMGYPADDAAPIEMHSTYRNIEEVVTYL